MSSLTSTSICSYTTDSDSAIVLTSADVCEQSLEMQVQLSRTFDSPMQIWRRRPDGWHPVIQESLEAQGSIRHSTAPFEVDWLRRERIDEWFDELVAAAESIPQSRKLSDHQTFVAVVSYANSGKPEIIGGRVQTDFQRLVDQTAELAVLKAASAGQQVLLDDYAHRLSSGYEEMAFLRQLSHYIKICVANRSLADATSAILPQLCELLSVEGVGLITPQPIQNDQVLPSPTQELSPTLGTIECCYGVWQPSQSELFEMINGLPRFENQTVVRNYNRPGQPSKHDSPLRSIVMTPVRSDKVLYGWLVGINKRVDVPFDLLIGDYSGRYELGSIEATLLESAAIMLSSHASNNRLYEELEIFMVQAIQTLVGVIEAKDNYTFGHSERVASIARRLAEEMKLSSPVCQDIYLAGLLHDIGKVGVPDDVLLKPGKLTDSEFAKIKLHPEIGARLIQGLKPLAKLVPGVLHHHEAFDGTGYPHRLAGDAIPLMGRVLAVADAFDAMTSCRPYRVGMTADTAEEILRSGIDKQWDGRVIEAFFACRSDIAQIISRPSMSGNLPNER